MIFIYQIHSETFLLFLNNFTVKRSLKFQILSTDKFYEQYKTPKQK